MLAEHKYWFAQINESPNWMMPGAIFKSVFYIHAEYILFLAEILMLKEGGKGKSTCNSHFRLTGQNLSASQLHFEEHSGKKSLFCMLKQLGAHAPELDMCSKGTERTIRGKQQFRLWKG